MIRTRTPAKSSTIIYVIVISVLVLILFENQKYITNWLQSVDLVCSEKILSRNKDRNTEKDLNYFEADYRKSGNKNDKFTQSFQPPVKVSSGDNEIELSEADANYHDDQFWAENDKKIELRFRQRQERLEQFCETLYPPELDHTMHDWNHRTRHFYVGDGKHKLLGCVPLKAGCTSWIFWQTTMHYPGTSKHSMNLATASVVNIGPELGNAILTDDDATRFLVVRHPLLRFYSGYKQKFKRADPLHKKLLRKSGYLRERSQIHINTTDDDMTLTFADFAHYIAAKISPDTVFNAHFRSQFKACMACNFRFDYIIKTEYMDEEANYILRKAGYNISPWDGFVQRGSTKGGISKGISHDTLQEPLSTISKDDIQKLYERYALDFQAFGYTVDSETLKIGGWES